MDLKTIMISREDPNWQFYVPHENTEVVQVKGVRNGLKRVNGHLLPQLCRNLSVIKSMEVRKDDTFVVTYPKSGTNWVAELCWIINNNCNVEAAKSQHHMSRASFIDMGWSSDLLKTMPSPRVFQSHLRLEFLPENIQNRAKVVYVVRNPKDVLVSLFYFLQKVPEDKFDGTMEELFDEYLRGEVMYGSWWEHINEYAKVNNIHIVHFEDLLEDSINETRKLTKFLGHDLSDEQLKKVVDFCSFDNLKNSGVFDIKMPPMPEHSKDAKAPALSPQQLEMMKSVSEMKLLRKGQIGDWKNYFTEEKWKAVDEIVATKLNYKKPFRFEPSK